MASTNWKARIAPELRAAYRMAPNVTFDRQWKVRGFRMLERFLLPTPRVPDDLTFREIDHDGQRIRIFEPAGDLRAPAAMLWIHGGGRIMGTPNLMDRHSIRVARRLGIPAVSISYRLAPEHRYPAALDDCVRGWSWLVERASGLGVDPSRIAIGGESAGGGLAAELAQRLYDEGGVQPAAQVLVYPMLDDRTATRDELTAMRHPVWNNQSNHYGWSSYLGVPAGSPDVSAYTSASRRQDLSGLPPAWLTVGDLDLFLDETLDYVGRLEAAGVETALDRVPGGFHGYFTLGRDETPVRRMWASLETFLER